jgi:hypothetical protein
MSHQGFHKRDPSTTTTTVDRHDKQQWRPEAFCWKAERHSGTAHNTDSSRNGSVKVAKVAMPEITIRPQPFPPESCIFPVTNWSIFCEIPGFQRSKSWSIHVPRSRRCPSTPLLTLLPVTDPARAAGAAPALAAARHRSGSVAPPPPLLLTLLDLPPVADPARAAVATPARAVAPDQIDVAVGGTDRRDGGGSGMAVGCLQVKRVAVWIEEMAVATAWPRASWGWGLLAG